MNCTIWFTGLSGSGKTTLSKRVEEALLERGLNVEVLDGDVVRTNLSKGLGFSKEDRDINIRRIGFVCNLLTRNGVTTIAAAISPYRAIREENRQLIKRYVEVYVRCPVEICIQRDPKGLYAKAEAGQIPNFTGISDPYEEPEKPEIVVDTDKEDVDQSVLKIIRTLELMNFIPTVAGTEYSSDEETKIKDRLKALGYI